MYSISATRSHSNLSVRASEPTIDLFQNPYQSMVNAVRLQVANIYRQRHIGVVQWQVTSYITRSQSGIWLRAPVATTHRDGR